MGHSNTTKEVEINNEAGRDKLTILIVDEKEACSILEKDIARLGHRVLIAGNYSDALKKISDNHFNLIVMDIDLHDRNGIGMISEIRRIIGDINIVTMTESNNREREQEVRAQRILYYGVKPLEFGEIRSILDHLSSRTKAVA